ncbi:tRNA (adenosine(37)-N6)-dimethylallyltransferase MiaA [Chloroflexota bacterium]
MNHLVAIIGPTGIGKSRLALHLAQNFNGEIVNADSRQVYRYLDIGTAKPGMEELSLVPHHLIDIVNPDEDFSLSQYQPLADQAIKDIQLRDKLPILVGGSGQYVWAILEGWRVPQVPPDLELRHNLEERAARIGSDALYQELVKVDAEAALKIDRRNLRRVIRALEVYEKSSLPFSHLKHKEAPFFNAFILGLTMGRAELYRRNDRRFDEMMERGLVAEVEKLVNMRYDFTLPSMSSIGYKQIGQFLKGELNLATAVQQIKFETHRFVRHQYSWFQLRDSRIHWFDIQNIRDREIESRLADFLNNEKIIAEKG